MRYDKEVKEYISENRFIDENLGGLPDAEMLKGIYQRLPFLEKENMTIEERYLIMFSYSHLPPNLRGVSKLFADFAANYKTNNISDSKILLQRIREILPQNIETGMCFAKIRESENKTKISKLRLIMEAKDCAIRAIIFHNQLA